MDFEAFQALMAKGFFDGRFKSLDAYDESYRQAIGRINQLEGQMGQLNGNVNTMNNQLQAFQGLEQAYGQVVDFGVKSGFLKDTGDSYEFVDSPGIGQSMNPMQPGQLGQPGQMGNQIPGQPASPQYLTMEDMMGHFNKAMGPMAHMLMGSQADNLINRYIMQVPEAMPYVEDLKVAMLDMMSRGENIRDLRVVDEMARAVAVYKQISPTPQPNVQQGNFGVGQNQQFGQFGAPAPNVNAPTPNVGAPNTGFQPFPQFGQNESPAAGGAPQGQGMQGQGFGAPSAPLLDFGGGRSNNARVAGRSKHPGEEAARKAMGISEKEWETQADVLERDNEVSLEDDLTPVGGAE